MTQQSDWKVKDFILELRDQAAKCDFPDGLEAQLHDLLIAGINISNVEREREFIE